MTDEEVIELEGELDALSACVKAIGSLTDGARERVMRYLAQRFPPPPKKVDLSSPRGFADVRP